MTRILRCSTGIYDSSCGVGTWWFPKKIKIKTEAAGMNEYAETIRVVLVSMSVLVSVSVSVTVTVVTVTEIYILFA